MAKREKITSKFQLINSYIIDEKYISIIGSVLNSLKIKGKALDKESGLALKKIVEKALFKVGPSCKVEIYWADYYEDAKMVKFKVVLTESINEITDLKIIADSLLTDLKVKQINYGKSIGIPTLLIWMQNINKHIYKYAYFLRIVSSSMIIQNERINMKEDLEVYRKLHPITKSAVFEHISDINKSIDLLKDYEDIEIKNSLLNCRNELLKDYESLLKIEER